MNTLPVFTQQNLWFVTGDAKDRLLIARLTASCDVIGVQEAKPNVLADILPPGWRVHQDTSSKAKAGSAILWNTRTMRKVGRFRLHLGCRPRGAKMLPRYIATLPLRHRATGKRYFAMSAHAPPKRYFWLRPEFLRNLRAVTQGRPRAVLMMDANMRIARMARKLGMKARGTGIDGIFVGRRCRFSGTVRVTRWGMRLRYTDHPAVTTAVESR